MSTEAVTTLSTWKLDPSHTNLEFAVKHLMISTVRGRFSDIAGTLQLDEERPEHSSVDVTVNVTSIDTRQPDRDAHLRSADFFDVPQFPTLRFKSGRIARSGGGFRVDGHLTIRGVTRPVTLDVVQEGQVRDPWGGRRTGFSARTKINRRDFGLTWNQALETGGFVVGDEVTITADVEFLRQED